jgi:glycosyltransferase involved in cell wall biosynthesis
MESSRDVLDEETVRITYVVLSPTFGMQQYTADLANRFAEIMELDDQLAHVTVITPRQIPIDRYSPNVKIQPIAPTTGTGLQKRNFNLWGLRKVYRAIQDSKPGLVHFTGPHIWNPILLRLLQRAGIPTIHTIHDVDPHSGTGYGRFLYMWNKSIIRWAGQILVHGRLYCDRLMAQGISPDRVIYTPLLHLFTSYTASQELRTESPNQEDRSYALFFARLESYKGIDILIEAMRQLSTQVDTVGPSVFAIVAGKGDLSKVAPQLTLPPNIELRNRLIEDAEAIELFRHCSLVVLPYRDATQSALVAAAYFFSKPVIVTRTGALPEYVCMGETGWIIEPNSATALANCLTAAFNHPDQLRQMGQAGRAWYESQSRDERRVLRHMYEQAGYSKNAATRIREHAKKRD